MTEKPFLIVTNDDGVDAPGILALAAALRTFAHTVVIAPSVNHSSAGHKKSLFQDIAVREVVLADGSPAISVGGSPADCIALAALGLNTTLRGSVALRGNAASNGNAAPEESAAPGLRAWPPALVVSGINRGANMGQDITYSGTVSAALEAAINGVPAVAVSLDRRDADQPGDYAEAARVAAGVVRHVLGQLAHSPLPAYTVLNLNVPDTAPGQHVRGLRITRQGVRIYLDALAARPGDAGHICRIEGEPPSAHVDEIGTDVWAVHRGYASLTPIHLDMTAHRLIADLQAWDF
jgi:5'-nucleotidase